MLAHCCNSAKFGACDYRKSVLLRDFCLDANLSRANKYAYGFKYSLSCSAYLSSVFNCSSRNFKYPNDFNSHSQFWFISAIIEVRYAIGTMLTNAEFERPLPPLALLLLPLLEASADDDIAPRDANRPAPSFWRHVVRQSHLATCRGIIAPAFLAQAACRKKQQC